MKMLMARISRVAGNAMNLNKHIRTIDFKLKIMKRRGKMSNDLMMI